LIQLNYAELCLGCEFSRMCYFFLSMTQKWLSVEMC